MNQGTALDAYFDTREEAFEEASRRRSSSADPEMIVRCEPTAYGTWRVHSVPADMFLDFVIDGPSAYPFRGPFGGVISSETVDDR